MESFVIKLEKPTTNVHVAIDRHYIVSFFNDNDIIIWDRESNPIFTGTWHPENWTGRVEFKLQRNLFGVVLQIKSDESIIYLNCVSFYKNGTLKYYGGINDINSEPVFEGHWK